MVEINVKQQETIIEISQANNIITIKSKFVLPASYTSIIDKFFSTFEIISIKEKITTEKSTSLSIKIGDIWIDIMGKYLIENL